MSGRVYFVGAGFGDPDLLPPRGLRRLAEASLVVHDVGVDRAVLALARPDATFLAIAPRDADDDPHAAARRDAIVTEVREGRVVVRLAQGASVLEAWATEAEGLRGAGVEVEVVPGPSALDAAAFAGIPIVLGPGVRLADATSGFAAPRDDLGPPSGTLVVVVDGGALEALMARLVSRGRHAATPAAIVTAVASPRQATLVGTVGSIAAQARAAGVEGRAIAVVGDVVERRETFRWFDRRPLFGARVLVTRPRERSDALAARLRDEGAEALCLPAIRIDREGPRPALARAVEGASSYDWLVFTSASGVEAFFDEALRLGRDARVIGRARVCAIGPATAASLAARGIRADLVPSEYRGEAVADAILHAHGAPLAGARVLQPRAEVAREILPTTLRAEGATVDVVTAYRNVDADPATREAIGRALRTRAVDVVTFTAPSTVEAVAAILGADAAEVLAPLVVASIGPVTTAAAEARGLRVAVTAREYTSEGLVDALRTHAARGR